MRVVSPPNLNDAAYLHAIASARSEPVRSYVQGASTRVLAAYSTYLQAPVSPITSLSADEASALIGCYAGKKAVRYQ